MEGPGPSSMLFHLLHSNSPPPNVTYYGIYNGDSLDAPLGFYFQRIDLPEGSEIK